MKCKIENAYDDLNVQPIRSEIYSMSKYEKLSLESIALEAKSDKKVIRKILNEEEEKRTALSKAMFKGGRYPTKEELNEDYNVKNMSTFQMGVKYGRPGKPVSENTVCRLLRKHNFPVRSKKSRAGLPEIPTKKELYNKLNVEHVPRSKLASHYQMRYGQLISLIEEYGLGDAKKRSKSDDVPRIIPENSAAVEHTDDVFRISPVKPMKIKKRKTVLDAYLASEGDNLTQEELEFKGD